MKWKLPLIAIVSGILITSCGLSKNNPTDQVNLPENNPSLEQGSVGKTSTFSSIQKNLLIPRCQACHSASNPTAGLNVFSYGSVRTFVQPGNAAQSMLYSSMASGMMPPGGPPVSSTQLSNVAQWINNGARNN